MIMSLKWNENFTLIFLNSYRKHPCLWNPHYMKYYDCLAKNEALKNIIKELNIPELNISDCLKHIKVIREKYGQEQIKVIKGFKSGKPYKSPFVWFPVIAGMLTKVIDEEGVLQNKMKSVEAISSLKDCDTTLYDKYKSISNFPCVQETRRDYKIKPRKNTKFTKTEDLDILDYKSKRQNDMQLLQCPSCGWEDVKQTDRLGITTKQVYEQIKPLDIAVPCSEYSDISYEGYKTHRHQIRDAMYQEEYNTIPCPSFRSISNYTSYPADSLTTHTYHPQGIRNYINQQILPGSIVTSGSKSCIKETQLLSEQLFPEKRIKQAKISGQHDKGIQNTVCMSKTETDVRKCYREIQNKFLTTPKELKQVAVNTTQQCDKEIQHTICACLSNSSFSKYSSTREAKQIDANTVECSVNDMQNMIDIKLKTVDGSMPNFISITTNGNYLPLIQRDLKELTINKCQKDTEIEKVHFALDDKKIVENEVCIKDICSRDIMEIIKQNFAMTQALLQCLEIIMQETTKISSVTSFLSKRDNENSNFELESLNCLSCMEKTEKDNVIAMFTKTFLELMKHALELNSKNVRESCVRKEDVINTFIVLNKVKECADEILKIYTLVDCSKRQLLDKFYPRSKSRSTCFLKQNSVLNSVQTQDTKKDITTDQFTTSFANSKDLEVLYGPSISKIKDHSLSENGTKCAETMTDELFVKDKDITARAENHDIGLNVSLPQISLRESGTQYTSKQLRETGIETDRSFEEKISVATQNREPMLIRVIKSNNSEGILKLDKETCVRDAHVLWRANADKRSKNMFQKYSIREYYDELLHPDVFHIREKEMNSIDYRMPLLPNEIYRYNKRYKSSLPCNYKVNIPNFGLSLNQRISRIPLYVRSRKYTRRRTELYRTSQSYI